MDESRLRELESKVNKIEANLLVSANDAAHAKKDVEAVKSRIDNLQTGINRLLWTGGAAFLAGVVNFILNGGLRVGL